MTGPRNHTISRRDIDRLLAFAPELEKFVTEKIIPWSGLQRNEEGVFESPCPTYPKVVRDFFAVAADPKWADRSYVNKSAGRKLKDDAYLAEATLDDIRTLLTYCVRGERFCEGHWASLLQSGRVLKILNRLAALRSESDNLPGG